MCALPNQDHVLILRAAELALPRYWQRFTSEEGIVTDADVAAFWERHGYARVESSVQAWNHVPVAVTEHNKCGCFGFHCCLLVLSLCVSVCLCVCLSVCVCLSLCVCVCLSVSVCHCVCMLQTTCRIHNTCLSHSLTHAHTRSSVCGRLSSAPCVAAGSERLAV